MPRKSRKKYPKLPAGFGSIKRLSGNRRKPFAVYPTYRGLDLNGYPIMPPALCYVDSWLKGFAVLTAYNAGTYTPGMEAEIEVAGSSEISTMNDAVKRLLADYSLITQRTTGKTEKAQEKTFAEVYEDFYEWKYNNPQKKYSQSSKEAAKTAFRHCFALHNRTFAELRHPDLQSVLDNAPYRHASLEHIRSLFKQMYAYADLHDLVERDYSTHVKIQQPDDDEHGVPFDLADIDTFWRDADMDETAEFLLFMCYTGHRISEYKSVTVDLEQMSLEGGLKTHAARNRIVPIHSAVQHIVKRRIERYGCLLPYSTTTFRLRMKTYLHSNSIEAHTPHDTRHTFSMLCEKYKLPENDRKRLLGHSFPASDVTNRIYGHRSLEELLQEIEKIPAPPFCC